MPLLNFSSQFAPLVSDESKRMTIRADRVHPIKTGDTLHLYTGCRTKKARRLLHPVTCTSALKIRIEWMHAKGASRRVLKVWIEGRGNLTQLAVEALARLDGHPSAEAFADWFLSPRRPVFTGQWIQW